MSATTDLIIPMGTAFRGAMESIRTATTKKEKQSTLALSILVYVEKSPNMSQGELGRMLRRDPMTMSQAVRALQNSGLVVSQPDSSDRRVKRLTPTKKGKNLADNINSEEAKIISQLAKDWGKSRVNQFAKDMNEFNEFLSRIKR